MKKIVSIAALLMLLTGIVIAHPHFKKTITASLDKGPELKLEHITLPYNEVHLKEVKPGFVFHCGRAKLNISKDVVSGNTKIPAGSYHLRAKAKTVDDWTLVLVPESAVKSQADMPKALESALALNTKTLTNHPNSEHLELNIMPGHSKAGDQLIVSVGFGTRVVEGVLSVPAQSAEAR